MSATVIAIVCPECDMHIEVSAVELGKELSRHNNLQHDGEAVAAVDGDALDRFGGGDR